MPNLDLLRSIAVLLVFVEHLLLALHVDRIGYWQIPWLGVMGVFLFFVHTCLVLLWSLERSPGSWAFYVRRFFRIYPMAIAVILVTFFFHIATMQSANGATFFRQPTTGHLVANLMLMQDMHGDGSSEIGVLWSLPLEVRMYVLLPLLFLLLHKRFRVWTALLLWSVVVAYDLYAETMTGHFTVCAPMFLSGAIAYVLYAKVRPRLPAFALPLTIFALLFAYMVHPGFPAGWMVTLTLGLTLPFFHQIRAPWLVQGSHQVARYSYGIYLLHPFCIAIGVNRMEGSNIALRVAVVVTTLILLAVPLYHLLEKPMVDLGARLARKIEKRRLAEIAIAAAEA